MEKLKDFIYEQSDLFFTAIIVVVVGIIITSNLYGWFDIKDKENKYAEITEVIQEEQTAPVESTSDQTAKNDVTAESSAKDTPDAKKSGSDESVKKEVRNVEIATGSSSSSIAKALENQGLVKSSSDFLNFLVSSGKETKLKAGTFAIPEGSTNQQIIEILTK